MRGQRRGLSLLDELHDKKFLVLADAAPEIVPKVRTIYADSIWARLYWWDGDAYTIKREHDSYMLLGATYAFCLLITVCVFAMYCSVLTNSKANRTAWLVQKNKMSKTDKVEAARYKQEALDAQQYNASRGQMQSMINDEELEPADEPEHELDEHHAAAPSSLKSARQAEVSLPADADHPARKGFPKGIVGRFLRKLFPRRPPVGATLLERSARIADKITDVAADTVGTVAAVGTAATSTLVDTLILADDEEAVTRIQQINMGNDDESDPEQRRANALLDRHQEAKAMHAEMEEAEAAKNRMFS